MTTSTTNEMDGDDRYRHAELLLAQRGGVIGRRLADRLAEVGALHDLSWRALLSSQREIARLHRADAEPTPAQFWDETAIPASLRLKRSAISVIDSEADELTAVVARFRATVQPPRRRLWIENDPNRVRASISTVLDPIGRDTLDPTSLNDIGRRWQRRLRRAAWRQAALDVLMHPAAETELHVTRAEMALLESAPWAQGDRLLSAFELAHAEVRSHLREMVSTASVVAPGRTVRRVETTV